MSRISRESYLVNASAVHRLHEELAHLDERERRATREYGLVKKSLDSVWAEGGCNWARKNAIEKSLDEAGQRVQKVSVEATHLRKFLRALGLEHSP